MSISLTMPETLTTILRSSDANASWNFEAGPALIELWCLNPTEICRAVTAGGREIFRTADPFAALEWMEAFDLSTMSDARWMGFITYEFSRCIERLPTTTSDGVPLGKYFHFKLCRPAKPDAVPPDERASSDGANAFILGRSLARDAYLDAARHALDYIAAGDVFQINLAQCLGVARGRKPHSLWKAISPSEYGALLTVDDATMILSNSPELFFRIEPQPDGSRKIVNRPIKGTRPNAPGMFDELSHSAKDRAELAMIVDLQRNDLGRVCGIGSVVVREPRVIEATPTVYHGVATIDGTLRRDAGFADVIRALFPCGSITGCPKVRAMEIIDELEPVARGPYCGAIGYLAADGSAEFNVAIRTMVIRHGIAHVYVGGGIVADSSAEAEYEETLVKAKAMLDALGVDHVSS